MSTGACILAVNYNRRNLELLEQYLGEAGYRIVSVTDLQGVDQALDGPDRIDLALVDITGFDRAIWTRCERLRDAGVPLLVVSPRQSREIEAEGLSSGARSVLVKPLVIRELLRLIESLLEE